MKVRFRSGFAYVEGRGQIGQEVRPLFRLRYAGSASRWGYAMIGRATTIMRSTSCPPVRWGQSQEALDLCAVACIRRSFRVDLPAVATQAAEWQCGAGSWPATRSRSRSRSSRVNLQSNGSAMLL